MVKQYTKENPLRVFTAFSGYDSQCLALKRLGIPFDLVGWSEIDPAAIQAHNALFPEYSERNYGDISKIDWSKTPNFDLFTYSSPCVTGDTMVETDNGLMKIIDIVNQYLEKDIYVKSVNIDEHNNIEFKKVIWGGLTRKSAKIVKIKISGRSSVLKCTFDHRVAIFESGLLNSQISYKQAGNLTMNDVIVGSVFNYNGGDISAYSIESIECGGEEEVYDITVEGNHNFFADNILVHNCTDFSNAGRQAGGEEGSGTRSSLLWECRKTILEKKPKYLLFENVKALVTEKFFRLFDKWCKELESYGYANYYKVLNSKDFGVPQSRERIFMVSILKTDDDPNPYYEFPRPIKLEKTVEDILEDNVPEKYYMEQEVADRYISIMKKEYPNDEYDDSDSDIENMEKGLW